MKQTICLLCMLLCLAGCAPQNAPLPMEPQAISYSFEALGGGMSLHAEPAVKPVAEGEYYALYRLGDASQVQEFGQQVGLAPLWQNRSVDEPYDHAYFQQRELLVVVRSTPSCSQVCWIDGVERLENTLLIHLIDGVPRAGDDGFGTAVLGIELSKEDLAAISDYEVLVQEQLICPT